MRTEKKQRLAKVRHWRVRRKVVGTREKPRMSVKFTGKNIYVQFIDDVAGTTLAATSTLSKTLVERDQMKANKSSAKKLGVVAAEAAKAKGIKEVVFDRGAARYHGKVKELADAAREAGLKF